MKYTRRFELRLTEEEARAFLQLETELGISRTELIRRRVLLNTSKVMVNATELLKLLDQVGSELGRCGNNINQLARHANTLDKRGELNARLIHDFTDLFSDYIRIQQDLEKVIRQILRLMKS